MAPMVGTPWLALATCPYPEYLLNYMPFYSVLAGCPSYPAAVHGPDCECSKLLAKGERTVCVGDDMVSAMIPETVARLLLDPGFTYDRALESHFARLRARGLEFIHNDGLIMFEGK